jgi:hypothetical protein
MSGRALLLSMNGGTLADVRQIMAHLRNFNMVDFSRRSRHRVEVTERLAESGERSEVPRPQVPGFDDFFWARSPSAAPFP